MGGRSLIEQNIEEVLKNEPTQGLTLYVFRQQSAVKGRSLL